MWRAFAVLAVVGAVLLDAPQPSLDTSAPRAFGEVPAASSLSVAPPAPPPSGEPAVVAADPPTVPIAEPDPVLPPAVPVTSGLLSELPAAGAPPVRLRLPSLGIDAPVVPVGDDAGEMEIPARADTIGWYRYGPAPGEAGSAVLAAHVAWRGQNGAFADLRLAAPGALVDVEFADGSMQRFRVIALASYDKQHLPVTDIFRRDGAPMLTLITCGGAFNPSLRSFEDNVVAYAVPVEVADVALVGEAFE